MLWENLKAVKAKHRDTTAELYVPAAAALLETRKIERWLEKRTPEEQERFRESLPLFIWGLDRLTE